MLAFANAFVAYFVITTDYGFNLTATKDISINRDNPQKVSEIFSIVISAKILLFFLSALIFTSVILTFDYFYDYRALYCLTFITVAGQVIFPTWLFQGIERMEHLAYLNVSAKLLSTVCLFVFIRGKEDVLLVPLINSMGFVVAGLLAIFVVFIKLKIKFSMPSVNDLAATYREGWYVFLSQLKISLFSTSNVLILGVASGHLAVGYYSAAEKIMRALAMLQVPVTSAVYPSIARDIVNNKFATMQRLKKLLIFGVTAYAIATIVMYIYVNEIISILYNDGMDESVLVLKIMLCVPMLIFINNIFGTQILLCLGKAKKYFWVLLIGAGISVVSCGVLSSFYGHVGAASALLLTETFIALGMFHFARKDFFGVKG